MFAFHSLAMTLDAWITIALAAALVLPNVDSLLCAGYALSAVRLSAEKRGQLIERLPLQSLPLTALIAGMTAASASFLVVLNLLALKNSSAAPTLFAVMTGLYVVLCGALIYAAVKMRRDAGKTRRTVAILGVLSAGVTAAEFVFVAAFLSESGYFWILVAELAILAAIALAVLARAIVSTDPLRHFDRAVITSAGLLNGALAATALLWLVFFTAVFQKNADLQLQESLFFTIPQAMVVLLVRGVVAAWTAEAALAYFKRRTSVTGGPAGAH